MHYSRGKTLGGSSAKNYMLYQRLAVDSMQRWADEVDDQGYTFEHLLPYFKTSVHYTPPNQALHSNSTNSQTPDAFSPTGGPLEVSFSNAVHVFGTWCQKAFIALGMKQINGFNSSGFLGSGLPLRPSPSIRETHIAPAPSLAFFGPCWTKALGPRCTRIPWRRRSYLIAIIITQQGCKNRLKAPSALGRSTLHSTLAPRSFYQPELFSLPSY